MDDNKWGLFSETPRHRCNRMVWRVARIVILVAIVICVGVAGWIFWGYHEIGVEQDEVKATAYDGDASTVQAGAGTASAGTGASDEDTSSNSLDWQALLDENPDCVGWFSVDGTTIDTPVVQTTDNETYATESFQGNSSYLGCPFLDSRTDTSGLNLLIYGHHITGTHLMFTDLSDAYEQGTFDTIGNATWSTPDGSSVVARPVCAMSVHEDYATSQTFSWTPSDQQILDAETAIALTSYASGTRNATTSEAAEALAEGRLVIKDGTVADASDLADATGTGQTCYVATTEDLANAAVNARNVLYHKWCDQLLADSTAQAADAQELLDGSVRVIETVCCSSLLTGQPWRTIVVFAIG